MIFSLIYKEIFISMVSVIKPGFKYLSMALKKTGLKSFCE